MESSNGGVNRFRHHRKTPSSDRFLNVSYLSQQQSASVGDELSEHDIFDTSADFSESTTSSSSSSTIHNPNPNHRFGILAVLPESQSDSRSVFNHKAKAAAASLSVSSSSSSSSTSSSRMIPTIPKRPAPVENRVKFHQSAPVNVPVLMVRDRPRVNGFDDVDEDEDDFDVGGHVMMPPHEIVAAKQSPLVACSVLEGVGRTLKGRDLRQVRNAVWRRTGFLD